MKLSSSSSNWLFAPVRQRCCGGRSGGGSS
jgi:hypothetical protein